MRNLIIAAIFILFWAKPAFAQEPVDLDFALTGESASAHVKITPMADPVPAGIQITLSTDQTAPGELFLAPFAFSFTNSNIQPQLIILDNNGHRVFERNSTGGLFDFKVITNGLYSYFDAGKFILMDNFYRILRSKHQIQQTNLGTNRLLILYVVSLGTITPIGSNDSHLA